VRGTSRPLAGASARACGLAARGAVEGWRQAGQESPPNGRPDKVLQGDPRMSSAVGRLLKSWHQHHGEQLFWGDSHSHTPTPD
jgi:hypothetical protein